MYMLLSPEWEYLLVLYPLNGASSAPVRYTLLHSTWLCITLYWLYLTLLDSTLRYHSSNSLLLTLRYSTMALLHSILDSILLYIGSTSLYITLPSFYFTLLDTTLLTMALIHSTWIDRTLHWLYFTLLDSTLLYVGSTSLYLTLNYSTFGLPHSTWFYITLQNLFFTLLHSTLL